MNDSSASHPLNAALAAAAALRPHLRDVREESSVDSLTLSGTLTRLDDAHYHQLLALRQYGHTVEIIAGRDGWSLTVQGDSPADPTLHADDASERALGSIQAAEMTRAVLRGDTETALELAADLPATVTLRVRNDPGSTGTHWISSEAALVALLTGPGWIAATQELDMAPHRLVVGDWRDRTVRTDGLILTDPNATASEPWEVTSAYPDRIVETDRPQLPSPIRFSGAPDVEGVSAVLHGVTRCLAWYGLASAARIAPDGTIRATVTGARTVEVQLLPTQVRDTRADVELYRWSSQGNDPARLEAARQAASLALVDQRDLATAAGPALRTARSLYELSRRGAIGEALAARRSARDAALGAARQAATAARQASGKAIERVLVQTAALAAVLLTHAGSVIGTGIAAVLIGAIAIVAAGSWAVTIKVELPSAEDGLKGELDDLNQYRDTLSQDDVDAIQSLQTTIAACRDLRAARRAVNYVYAATLVGALASAVWLLEGTSSTIGRPTPTYAPKSSTTTPTSGPASPGPSPAPTRPTTGSSLGTP